MQLSLLPSSDRSQDDNLIRLMLQPPKTGKDDPLIQQGKVIGRKRRRSATYKV